MLTINEILAIVRSQEADEIRYAVVISVIMAAMAIPCAVFIYHKMRKAGIAFCVICAGFLYSMATKPPQPNITWSAGLFNNGSSFNTNTWKSIVFKWINNATVSISDTIYFAAKDRNYPDLEYVELGSTQVDQHQWTYTFSGQENATNYIYYAFTLGDVHTNGVWLGSILQKTLPGTGGPDKMIFIMSKLYENGKKLTPTKE